MSHIVDISTEFRISGGFSTENLRLSADKICEETNLSGEFEAMIISIAVSDVVVREAVSRGQSVEEFVEKLIDQGMATTTGRPVVSSAIDRIRALRSNSIASK
jgi:hypothetical protein